MTKNLSLEVMELTDQIYDTLMGLVGMSEHHVPMPDTDYQFVDRTKGQIYLRFGKNAYLLTVKEVDLKSFEDIESE
jgi:hypothetical protein